MRNHPRCRARTGRPRTARLPPQRLRAVRHPPQRAPAARGRPRGRRGPPQLPVVRPPRIRRQALKRPRRRRGVARAPGALRAAQVPHEPRSARSPLAHRAAGSRQPCAGHRGLPETRAQRRLRRSPRCARAASRRSPSERGLADPSRNLTRRPRVSPRRRAQSRGCGSLLPRQCRSQRS